MRPAQLAFILDREFESTSAGHHTPVMLWGPPGVGKSQIVAQVAARHGVPVIDIRLSQMEPSDLRGIPFRIENREWIARHGQQPDTLLYFTDADGEFPREAPNYSVLWLVKGKAPVPFGRRIQLN